MSFQRSAQSWRATAAPVRRAPAGAGGRDGARGHRRSWFARAGAAARRRVRRRASRSSQPGDAEQAAGDGDAEAAADAGASQAAPAPSARARGRRGGRTRRVRPGRGRAGARCRGGGRAASPRGPRATRSTWRACRRPTASRSSCRSEADVAVAGAGRRRCARRCCMRAPGAAAAAAGAGGKVNLNRGHGRRSSTRCRAWAPSTAEKIVADREANGPFKHGRGPQARLRHRATRSSPIWPISYAWDEGRRAGQTALALPPRPALPPVLACALSPVGIVRGGAAPHRGVLGCRRHASPCGAAGARRLSVACRFRAMAAAGAARSRGAALLGSRARHRARRLRCRGVAACHEAAGCKATALSGRLAIRSRQPMRFAGPLRRQRASRARAFPTSEPRWTVRLSASRKARTVRVTATCWRPTRRSPRRAGRSAACCWRQASRLLARHGAPSRELRRVPRRPRYA